MLKFDLSNSQKKLKKLNQLTYTVFKNSTNSTGYIEMFVLYLLGPSIKQFRQPSYQLGYYSIQNTPKNLNTAQHFNLLIKTL